MTAKAGRDFAALLDEILAEHEIEAPAMAPVSLDYLSVADELHSGRIRFAEESVRAEYRNSPAGLFQKPESPLSTDPEEIARELGLRSKRLPKDLDRVRRDFAFRNHPDRVAEHLRQRAIVRMQIANTLIDEAKRLKRQKA